MRYSNKVKTGPSVEPVTSAELDSHLRGNGVLETADSSTLDLMITAAREYAEVHMRRPLINTTYTFFTDTLLQSDADLGWWDGVREGSMTKGQQDFIELPMAGLQSVTFMKTYDSDNSETVFSDTLYHLDTNSDRGRLILNSGAVWPSFTRNRNGVEIEYVAGYGSAATDVPGALKIAVLQLATHWYENRELTKTQSDQNQAMAPMHVLSILNKYKVHSL